MCRRDTSLAGIGSTLLLAITLTAVLSGCGSFSGMLKSDDSLTAGPPDAVPTEPASSAPSTADPVVVATESPIAEAAVTQPPTEATTDEKATATLLDLAAGADLTLVERTLPDVDGGSALAQDTEDIADLPDEVIDPWEPFNEKMFELNRRIDRWVFKPAARAYGFVMPEPWQVMISNGFDNINFVPRFVNSLLQGKWGGAGRELARFLINSTAGIGGLFDPAKDFWGIHKSREDFGQTLGVWGTKSGPYLVLPLMEPLTVRDGIGKFVDAFMDPLSYVLPFFWDRLGMKAGDALNDRSLNYDLFQGFEESVIDMYSAVRHGYLQRRQQLIRE